MDFISAPGSVDLALHRSENLNETYCGVVDIDMIDSKYFQDAIKACRQMAEITLKIGEFHLDRNMNASEDKKQISEGKDGELSNLIKKSDLIFSSIIRAQRMMVSSVIEAKNDSMKERRSVDKLNLLLENLKCKRSYLSSQIMCMQGKEMDYLNIDLIPMEEFEHKFPNHSTQKSELILERLQYELDCCKQSVEKQQQYSKKRSQILLEKKVEMVELEKLKKELKPILLSLKTILDKRRQEFALGPTPESMEC